MLLFVFHIGGKLLYETNFNRMISYRGLIMTVQKIGYRRVSTSQQKHDRQLIGLELTKVFTETASGSQVDRPILNEMISYIREGDTVYIHSLDRLGRNALHTLTTIETMLNKGVTVTFVNENMSLNPTSNDPMKKLLLAIFSYFAEFEKNLAEERRNEGIEIGKRKGNYKGKQPRHTEVERQAIVKEYDSRDKLTFKKIEFLKKHRISNTLLWRYRKEYEQKLENELISKLACTMNFEDLDNEHT